MKTKTEQTTRLVLLLWGLSLITGLVIFAAAFVWRYWPSLTSPEKINPLYTTIPTQPIQPTATETQWEWRSLDNYNAWVSLPAGWTITETNMRSYNDPFDPCPSYQVDYSLDGPNRDNITLYFLCGPRGGDSWPCPDDALILDDVRQIARAFQDGIYSYGGYSVFSDGKMYCNDGWGEWGIETMKLIAVYKNAGGAFDLQTADTIILSVQPK